MASVRGASVLHFACHGYANLFYPLASGLFIAGNDMITVEDLLRERLDGAQLVVLSACQSGVPGTQLIGEVVGLPTALLHAGASAVIATMWSIDDLAAMLLIHRFYFLWRRQSLAPVEALRLAQQWLRDTTNAEKLRDIAADDGEPADSAITAILLAEGHDKLMFVNIDSWGAFSYIGRRVLPTLA